MHLLMISLDSSLLGDPHGNTVTRHLEYARRIGAISIVTYNTAVHPQTVQRLPNNLTVYPTNTWPVLFPWVAYRVAVRIQHAQPVDVITTQDPFSTGLVGWLLKRRFELPLDVQNHSHFFENPYWLAERPLRHRLLYRLGEMVIRNADTVRVATEREKAAYVKRGVPADRIAVLHPPSYVARFTEPVPPETLAARRAALGIAPDAPVLLWVGMPGWVKNVELLLEAYRRVRAAKPETRLVLAGDFSERADLVQQAQPDGVIFAGRVAHDDLPQFYQMADLYVHSSRYEGVPRVLSEALASGTPVVSTDHLGADAVVQAGETGLLTEQTPDALAKAILELLGDPTRRRTMGRAGQQDVLTRFDYERQIDAVVNTYQCTLEAAGQKGC
ncbi:MAG: glycosyltransferase family 4 protein [Chloroflexi bacterium]|nr:glycosyltransferase family 4 protein [Chloroflexota bacterium]